MKSFREFVDLREGVFNINDPSFLQNIQAIQDPAERQRLLAFYQQHRQQVNQNAALRQKNFANADTVELPPQQPQQPVPAAPLRKKPAAPSLGDPDAYQQIMKLPQPARDYWLNQIRQHNARQKPLSLDHVFHGILA